MSTAPFRVSLIHQHRQSGPVASSKPGMPKSNSVAQFQGTQKLYGNGLHLLAMASTQKLYHVASFPRQTLNMIPHPRGCLKRLIMKIDKAKTMMNWNTMRHIAWKSVDVSCTISIGLGHTVLFSRSENFVLLAQEWNTSNPHKSAWSKSGTCRANPNYRRFINPRPTPARSQIAVSLTMFCSLFGYGSTQQVHYMAGASTAHRLTL